MKIKNVFISLILVVLMVFSFVSCSYEGGSEDYGGGSGSGMDSFGSSEGKGSADAEIGDTSDSTEPSDEKTEDDNSVPAGLITAGAWNDNDNYEYWKQLFEQGDESNGKFFNYSGDNSWGFSSYRRIKVVVKNGDNTVAGAKVIAKSSGDETLFSAVSDASGVAYLFVSEQNGKIKVTSSDYSSDAEFSEQTTELTVNLNGAEEKKNIIDIMFVVDVTGSMGDELSYLKAEIADVINRVCTNNSETVVNLAFLFYRDSVDAEEFKYYDFVNVTAPEGLAIQQSALDSQHAKGGGDFPESVDEALIMAMEKQWSTGATTKLIFHVLDAPPHSTQADKTNYKAAVDAAAEKGIRICPILCSGSDTLTEYLVRQAAIYTGGTFIYITDDSGIGNSHHDPNLPNVTIEALNSLLVRLINGYHSGTFADPVDWRQEVK